jgi:hypothetical protein
VVKKMLRTTVPLVGVTLLMGLLFAARSGGQTALPAPQQLQAEPEGLRCPNRDRILHLHFDMAGSQLGIPVSLATGPLTPEEAARGFLRHYYPKLADIPLTPVVSTLRAVQFAYEPSGERKANFYVSLITTMWHLDNFTACNTILEEGS